ncbi:Cytoskeletal protein syp1 [Lachnellula suecica]|uniref:Cytoskeletal protein syp1 n=1 Tax=Lachnellula suecica TaxID=602035 RepID=A0A8T9C3C1_9HELO|nr:Cytoskeletal protein syp1 [Lachnellula suecica]
MDALSRKEYPAMLDHLQPAAAVTKFNERVKRIGKVNTEIADWLQQERRKVEEAYVAGLKKLARRPLQEVGGELGIFNSPWKKILASTEEIASSHYTMLSSIDKDVEQPLRDFSTTNRDMQQMATVAGNLNSIAKELTEAQEKSEKLSRKGGKASAQKVDQATSRLQNAEASWDSQAPFIFENLQALDERRLNHLRDVLTQFETHQNDCIERNRKSVEQAVSSLLEVDTSQEIKTWSTQTVAGKPMTERKARQLSTAGSTSTATIPPVSTMPPPPTPPTRGSSNVDDRSEHSSKNEKDLGKNLKSRFGTMMGKRRQSIHGGFARAPSPSKSGFIPFGGRSSDRPSPSPRASSNNLREADSRDNRLSSLAESPPPLSPVSPTNGTNGVTADSMHISGNLPGTANGTTSALTDLSDVKPPPGPPPSHLKEAQKDSDGFTVPAAMNDPISQAQMEAQDGEQPSFKLDIRQEPIPEQEADVQAALSNVSNTLRSSQMVPPSRKVGTLRGRRDVRNTIFVPSTSNPNSLEAGAQEPMPPSPNVPAGRAAALAALSSSEHHSAPSISDTNSIRSAHSLTNNPAVRHPEMHGTGLNASIIETVHASFENGTVQTAKISGEIALTYNKDISDDSPLPPDDETIRINNFPNLEVIGPNRTFIHPASSDKTDEYTIDLTPIMSKSAPTAGFTYRVHTDDTNLASQAPLFIKPQWKVFGDKANILIEYALNPASGANSLTFNNLFIVFIYNGGRATGCQTKPTGTHVKEKSLVYWRLNDVTLTTEMHKIVCRLVGAPGAMPEPSHVEARWEVQGEIGQGGSGISMSRLEPSKGKEKVDDPFADEGSPTRTWFDVPLGKKFVSGKYEAKPV